MDSITARSNGLEIVEPDGYSQPEAAGTGPGKPAIDASRPRAAPRIADAAAGNRIPREGGNAAYRDGHSRSVLKANPARVPSSSLLKSRTGGAPASRAPSQPRSASNPKRFPSPAPALSSSTARATPRAGGPANNAASSQRKSSTVTGRDKPNNLPQSISLSQGENDKIVQQSPSPRTTTGMHALSTPKRTSIRSPMRPNQSPKPIPVCERLPSPAFTDRAAQKKLILDGTSAKLKSSINSASRKDPLRASYEGGLNNVLKRHSVSSLVQQIPATPSRRKSDGRDPRSLQQMDARTGDDVRLDLRGQSIRRLDYIHVNLTAKLEFVYLRDNNLSSLNGIEVLRRVKVLDLSFNEFKGGGFEPLTSCKLLQQLYLAGNQITSVSGLPQLPNLEFLSVAQNKLKSLAMPMQPKLQVLAASNNKVSTFKGFPYLPMLEHLRLEENPILDVPHVEAASVLIVGSTLKRFNNKDLSEEEQKLALRYPPHTALCMREGWEFCSVDAAAESTLQFLVAQWSDKLPPGYTVTKASINPPSEEDCCSCLFVLEKEGGIPAESDITMKYQWYIGDKNATNFTPIEDAVSKSYWPKNQDVGCCLKVDCTPMVGELMYPSIFAISSPVAPGTGCPKVLSLRVNGELVEGCWIQADAEVAWCGGTPGKGIVSWLRRHGSGSPVAIMGAEEHEYQLTVDDVAANLLLMYTPVTEEGIKGESHFATTAVIQAASPHVSCVQISGPFVEGTTIKGTGKYFGGREGMSKFEWFREDSESGEFNLMSKGTTSYTLCREDVGLLIMFIYTPVNFEGLEGDPASTISGRVSVAPPKATHLRIVGDIREGNIVSISAKVVGGEDDASRVQWFKAESLDSYLKESDLEPISSSKLAKDFRIPLSAVGCYLVAKYVPARADGESGDPVMICSDYTVGMLPPSLTFLSIIGEVTEGETLHASYGYVGGYEGSSSYNWYLHKDEKDHGTLISSAEGLSQYKITKDDVDKLISFKCTPVRDDGLVGEPRSTMVQDFVRPGLPKLLSLEIVGELIEGEVLRADKKYWGGAEGTSKYQWFLSKTDGTRQELKGANDQSYTIRSSDIDELITVSCEPVRVDGVKGSAVLSQPVGPVLPGLPTCDSLELCGQAIEGGSLTFRSVYKGGDKGACTSEWYRRDQNGKEDWLSNNERLDLTSKDIGCHISVVFTPVRKDGLSGDPFRITSGVVINAAPVGINISIPDCCEGKEVIARKSYYGGIEGLSEYKWFRLPYSFRGATLPDEASIVASTMTYTPALEDVGMYLMVCWTPVRSDGERGKSLLACCNNPVAPAMPTVSDVCVKKVASRILLGSGEYHGGFEGNSKMSWYRDSGDGIITLIGGATSKTYSIVEEDYMCCILFGYTPVRDDGAIGKMIMSEKSALVLPDIPRPQKVALSGKACENEVLTASGVAFETEVDEKVWHKYKRDLKFQWLRSSVPGSMESFESLPLQRASTYKVRSEDVGFLLQCECVMTDIFGRASEPVSSVTPPVSPGVPKMDKLEIEGRGYHTNLYAVRGIYSGGREGKSMIQWFRAVAGRPDLIPIIGEVGRMYEANVDDIGCRLVAVYTPVREDGIGGAPVSASTDPITVEPEVAKEVKQKLELGAVKFEALRDRDQSTMKAQHGLGSLERRVLDVNKKRFKVVKPGSKTSFPNTEIRGSYVPPFRVEIVQNDQHRLKIVVENDNEVDLMVQTRNLRDVIVLVLRGFAQRFNGQFPLA